MRLCVLCVHATGPGRWQRAVNRCTGGTADAATMVVAAWCSANVLVLCVLLLFVCSVAPCWLLAGVRMLGMTTITESTVP